MRLREPSTRARVERAVRTSGCRRTIKVCLGGLYQPSLGTLNPARQWHSSCLACTMETPPRMPPTLRAVASKVEDNSDVARSASVGVEAHASRSTSHIHRYNDSIIAFSSKSCDRSFIGLSTVPRNHKPTHACSQHGSDGVGIGSNLQGREPPDKNIPTKETATPAFSGHDARAR